MKTPPKVRRELYCEHFNENNTRECKNIPFSARGVSEHGAPVPSEQLREGHGPQGGRRGRARAAAVGRPHGVPHVLHLHVRRSVAFSHWRICPWKESLTFSILRFIFIDRCLRPLMPRRRWFPSFRTNYPVLLSRPADCLLHEAD